MDSGEAALDYLTLSAKRHWLCFMWAALGKEGGVGAPDRGDWNLMRTGYRSNAGSEQLFEKHIAILTIPDNLDQLFEVDHQAAERNQFLEGSSNADTQFQ